MAWPVKQHLYIAVITQAHGVKGECKVKLLSDLPDRLVGLEEVSLYSPDGKRNLGTFKLTEVRGNNLEIIRLEGVTTREAAEKLKGAYLAVERADAYELEDGQYFIADLIGMEVRDEVRGKIGVLAEVSEGVGTDLLRVSRGQMKDLYLPVQGGNLLDVNFAEGFILVSLPEGLWEIYA